MSLMGASRVPLVRFEASGGAPAVAALASKQQQGLLSGGERLAHLVSRDSAK
jgi:hypothetical protein